MKKSCSTCRYGNNCPYGGIDLFLLMCDKEVVEV